MASDAVDGIIEEWRRERTDLDPSSLAVVSRILMLYRDLEQSADRALAPLGLTLWQFDVLSALRRSGRPFCLTPTELTQKVTLSSGAMTHRIDRLEAMELVSREADPDDRRGVRIRLTPSGRRVVDDAAAARFEEARSHLAGFSERELRLLEKLLRRLLLEVRSEDADRVQATTGPNRRIRPNSASLH